MLRTALLALSLLCAAGAHAQVHKCVDSRGKVTYSQAPCPADTRSGSISRRIDAPTYSPPAAESAEKGEAAKAPAARNAPPRTPAEQEQAFRKRRQDQAKAQKEAEQKAAQAAARETNCRSAKERLAQYEVGGRLSRVDAKGERYYLDDSQIEEHKARARADIAQACN
ncbi:MAG: DUF4124 domain-containing protein [Burkholderiales bacterium]